jgi:hypothetical protein
MNSMCGNMGIMAIKWPPARASADGFIVFRTARILRAAGACELAA